jgi:hypothetical protein
MRSNFPRTLKAAEASEHSQWAIADALLAEAEDKETGPRGLRAVEKELQINGIELSTNYLSQLRRTAEVFPAKRRYQLPWTVHRAAGNPDRLDAIVKSAKKTGEKITMAYVLKVLQQMDRDLRKTREAAEAEAKKELEKAEVEHQAARKRTIQANSFAERRERQQEQREAATRRKTAVAKVRATRLPPTREREAPIAEEVHVLAIVSDIGTKTADALADQKHIEELFDKYGHELKDVYIDSLVEDAMMLSARWREFAVKVQKKTGRKGRHLSVVS